ncbi:MAG: histidinol-phosphate transaminase [Kiritimatiellae bacterium]|nr:histidinol-phosphate transaminase [Kiritimatiellia bacterium]
MRVTKSVRRLAAYVPGEQPRSKAAVKLNTNENPYPPSPRCAAALRAFDPALLRRYPDPVFTGLRKELARLNGTAPENVMVGNGSDEILTLAAKAFVEDDERIASLDPSYSLYKTLAAIRGVGWTGVPAECGDVRRFLPRDASLFLWTNPNAPTGALAAPEKIARFARGFRGVVVVDEAYADFASANCIRFATAAGNRNLVVMRTFSKSYSLAGLRVGYCVGPAPLIAALYKVKDSYNVDAVAQAVALAAVKDQKWMKANVAKVVKTRDAFTAELRRRGWDVPPSESNFVFARPPRLKAENVFRKLRERGVYVRYFKGAGTGDRLRVTIGTDAQMKKLLAALEAVGA